MRQPAASPCLDRVSDPVAFRDNMVTIFIKPQRGKIIRLKVLLGDIVEKAKAMIDAKADISPISRG